LEKKKTVFRVSGAVWLCWKAIANTIFLLPLQKKDDALSKANAKVKQVTGKDFNPAEEDTELDRLMTVKKDLLKKIRDLEDTVEELKDKVHKK